MAFFSDNLNNIMASSLSDPNKFVNFYKDEIAPSIEKWPGFFVLLAACLVEEYFLSDKVFAVNILAAPITNITALLCLTSILILSYWLYLRKIPSFSTKSVGILIAVTKIDPEADKDILKIYQQLISLVGTENLQKEIQIKLVPERLLPNNQAQAFKLLHKSGAGLIIWGAMDKGIHNKNKKTLFTPIAFSYEFQERRKNVQPLFQNIGALLSQKKWIIDENTELFDRQYISKNIEELCLYILGLAFFFKKDFDIAVNYLSKVLEKYTNKSSQSNDDRIAIANTSYIIDAIYRIRIKKLELWPTSPNQQKHKEIACQMIADLSRLGFPTELLDSQVAFVNNDISGSINYAIQARRKYPTDPAPCFSLSFLAYHQGDIDDGNKFIYQATYNNPKKIGDQLVLILIWFQGELKANPQKSFLNFPLGIINYEIGNYLVAKDCFEKTLEYLNGRTDKLSLRMQRKSHSMIRKISRKLA